MHWLALLVFCGNQTYSYNIRGWLKTLGSSLTDGYTQTNYYQESGAAAPRFNGNISRIDWGGKEGSGGAFKTRTYNYIYDHANRLKTANFTASGEANRFNVTGITYDANGNIYSMERRNQRATSDYNVVDDLEYSYNRFSNRLSQVKDNNLSTGYTAKDFVESGSEEYGYDENGNMTANVDKEITLITYNHLNLPQEITFESGAQLRFAYDAAGNKMTQKVYNSSGVLTKTQDYIGEIVLLDGALDYLIHEEGRLVAEVDGLWGEYYLKDHLGNIRQVLRAPTSQSFMATMETQNASSEELAFSMVSESRQTEPAHNVTVGGNQVAWLNANRGRMVGPGRTQEIYAGDSLKLQVHGKYLEDKKQKANAASFMASGGKERLVADLNELALSNQRAGGANPIALLNLADILAKDLQSRFLSGGAPEAYLMYALYDQDSNRYEVGKKVLSKNAANQHEILEEEMYISKDGYMETFVVNETSEDVWFDNMMVMSVSSVIVQETHYDPWGLELTGLGYQYGGIKKNKYLFNGKERQPELGWDDFGPRMYMSDIGRWGVIDPAADAQYAFSPYHFAYNNPIRFNDPSGLIGEDFMQGLASRVVNEETGEVLDIDDGYDFEFSVSADEFAEISESGSIKGTSAYNRWFWTAVGHELQRPSGDTWFDQLMQFFVYDDAGDAIITTSEGQYTAAALGLALNRLKIGKGSKMVKKLFKYGKKSNLPTPDLNPEQFTKKGGKWVHKETGAIYDKSLTKHGNVGNAGDQWKAWPKGTTDFGKASKTTGTRVTIDGAGNVIGN